MIEDVRVAEIVSIINPSENKMCIGDVKMLRSNHKSQVDLLDWQIAESVDQCSKSLGVKSEEMILASETFLNHFAKLRPISRT